MCLLELYGRQNGKKEFKAICFILKLYSVETFLFHFDNTMLSALRKVNNHELTNYNMLIFNLLKFVNSRSNAFRSALNVVSFADSLLNVLPAKPLGAA